MYISENYLAFYSYLLGFELKVLIELKNIKDIFKEPIRKLFRHSMKVTTKDNQEVTIHTYVYLYKLLISSYSIYLQTCLIEMRFTTF